MLPILTFVSGTGGGAGGPVSSTLMFSPLKKNQIIVNKRTLTYFLQLGIN